MKALTQTLNAAYCYQVPCSLSLSCKPICKPLSLRSRRRHSIVRNSDQGPPSEPTRPQQPEQEPPSTALSGATPVVEASNVFEADAATDFRDSDILPLLPDALVRKSVEGFTALCVANVAVGIGLAAAAALSPALLLPSSISSSPLATTMLGCAGVAFVRVGSIFWFLRTSASIGEAATWRHQRLNATAAAFAAIALVSQLFALPASAPVFSGLVLVLVAGTLALCAQHARECWSHGPWLQWLADPEDVAETLDVGLRFLRRDLSSLAGITCLGLLAVCAGGLVGLGQGSTWAQAGVPHTCVDGIYGPGCSAAAVQALNGLRRLCIAGLLPAAMVAHSLLELATHVRAFSARGLVANQVLGSFGEESRIGRVLSPPPERFTTLFWLGLFAAGIVQAVILFQAPSLGVDVNRDALLMAPQFWVTGLSGVFSLTCIFVVDWVKIQLAVGKCLHAVFSLVSGLIATTIIKHEWTVQHKL